MKLHQQRVPHKLAYRLLALLHASHCLGVGGNAYYTMIAATYFFLSLD